MPRATVNAIRPDSLAEKTAKAREHDHAWFCNQAPFFKTGFCPVCEAGSLPDKTTHISPSGATYKRCQTCGTLCMTPHPTEAQYAAYYPQSQLMRLFAEDIFKQSAQARHELIYAQRLKRMLGLCRALSPTSALSVSPTALSQNAAAGRLGGAYIEIGAGSGVFASLVQESGFFDKVIAIEPNADCATDCRNNKLYVVEKMAEQVDFQAIAAPLPIKAVGLFETLEHLTNPRAFLNNLSSQLPVGTLLFLSTPSSMGFDVVELGGASTALGWTHVHLFNPYSIQLLLEQCGFSAESISTPGLLDVDLVARACKQGMHTASPWLTHLLTHEDTATETAREDFQNFLVAHNMSSHMWAVGKKL